jgi:Ca-activated chloride channel family protein
MLSLVVLLACSSVELPVPVHEGEDPQPEVVQADPPAGQLLIATAADVEPMRVAPVERAGLPSAPLIQRSCFNAPNEGSLGGLGTRGQGYGGGGGYGSGGAANQAPAKPKGRAEFRPTPAAPPAAPAEAAAPATAFDDAKAPAAEPPPMPAPSPAPVPASPPPPADGGPQGEATRARESAKKEAVEMKTKPGSLGDTESDEAPARSSRQRPPPKADKAQAVEEERAPQVVLDWGATVYLSNDDSMSLASAQRMLYALKQGRPLSPGEVRPHELLNYFSFDVAPIADGQRFSVLGAAEQTGDVLSVSLAVRGANPIRQPLDLSLVVDRSGSMTAEGRMDYTKRGMLQMVDQLQTGDRLDLVLFDSNVCTPLENFVVGRDDLSLLRETINSIQPNSSTDLDAGLREAWRIHDQRDEPVGRRNARVVLITDAMLNSGLVNEALVSEVARRYEEDSLRLTGIGVGREFNDTLLNQLTEKGKGAYVYLGSEAVVDRVFGPGFDSLTRTIAHDVQFSLELPPSLAMKRFYGEESSTNAADVQPIHYFAGTTQLFLQDLAVRDGRVATNDPLRMRIRYRDAITGEPAEEVLHTTVGALLDGDRHNLHKGQALMAFSDVVMAQAMGADACDAPLATYTERSAKVADDAEVLYTNGLIGGLCQVDLATVAPPGVAYKVRVDADMPIAEVELRCGDRRLAEKLSGSDTVARFASVQPGACTVELQGNVPMVAAVEVPSTGGDVRCVVRGGRLSCG